MLNGCGSNDIALVSFSFSCSFWRVQRAETLKRDAAAEPDSWPCWKPHERHVNPTPIRQLFIEIYMGCVQEVLLQAWPNPCPNSDSDPDFDFSVYGSSSIWTRWRVRFVAFLCDLVPTTHKMINVARHCRQFEGWYDSTRMWRVQRRVLVTVVTYLRLPASHVEVPATLLLLHCKCISGGTIFMSLKPWDI